MPASSVLPKTICPCGSTSPGGTTGSCGSTSPGGSRIHYGDCCEPLHLSTNTASTPEQLMRSRYSAFVFGLGDYLIKTHHPDTRGQLKAEELSQLGKQTEWVGLQILATEQVRDDFGTVEFKAWFHEGGKIKALHENSNFYLVDGNWFYHSGELFKADEVGRNSPCPCGSGLKAKRCHLK